MRPSTEFILSAAAGGVEGLRTSEVGLAAPKDYSFQMTDTQTPPFPTLTLEDWQHWTWVMGRAQQMLIEAWASGQAPEQPFNRQIAVDVRVVSSSSRDLAGEMEEKNFREDLFYRLNVVPVAIPSLAERRDDIPALADHFFTRYAAEQGIAPPEISADAIAALQAYDWPGNVRQLRNVVERTVILTPRDQIGTIEADMLFPSVPIRNDGISDIIPALRNATLFTGLGKLHAE